MTDVVLYYAPGTCARVPMISLEEAGQDFDARVVAFLAGEHKDPEFLTFNPAGKVPALIIDGQPLSENVAIVWYLAQHFPDAKLLPMSLDPIEQAQILSDLSYCASVLHPLVTRIRLPQTFCTLPDAAQDVWNIAAAAMDFHLCRIEERLKDRPWWYGEEWSSVDAYINWVWMRVTGAGISEAAYPNLADHDRRFLSRPAVQRALHREEAGRMELKERGLNLVFHPVGSGNDDQLNVFLSTDKQS